MVVVAMKTLAVFFSLLHRSLLLSISLANPPSTTLLYPQHQSPRKLFVLMTDTSLAITSAEPASYLSSNSYKKKNRQKQHISLSMHTSTRLFRRYRIRQAGFTIDGE